MEVSYLCPYVSIILLMCNIFCSNVPSGSLNVPAIWELFVPMCKLSFHAVCQLLVSICTSNLYQCIILLCQCLINPFLRTLCVSFLYLECKLSVLACQLFVTICVTHLICTDVSSINLYVPAICNKWLAVCTNVFPVCKPFVSICVSHLYRCVSLLYQYVSCLF